MSRIGRALRIASVTALAGAAAAGAHAAPRLQCTPRTIGPGALVAGGTKGAACLVAAFRSCTPADYVLSGFAGGETVIVSFSVQHWEGGCAVLVIRSVGTGQVHDRPVVTGPRVCRRLHATPSGAVADRCTRGNPAVIPLTAFA